MLAPRRTAVEKAARLRMVCLVVVVGLATSESVTFAGEPPAGSQGVELSPELMALLRSEMVEIANGVQALTLSLATGDWHSIQQTSSKIQASYILAQKLTAAQAEELEHALPEPFRRLDAEFHRRAGKLGEAAEARDAELAAFHFARLLESCAACHAAYAGKRFPGFASTPRPAHHH